MSTLSALSSQEQAEDMEKARLRNEIKDDVVDLCRRTKINVVKWKVYRCITLLLGIGLLVAAVDSSLKGPEYIVTTVFIFLCSFFVILLGIFVYREENLPSLIDLDDVPLRIKPHIDKTRLYNYRNDPYKLIDIIVNEIYDGKK